ncbi:MAG: hypothetical protein QM706_11575 [Nitrospira sp.]
MGITTRVEFNIPDNWNGAPTAQELSEVPTMTHAEMTEVMKSTEYKTSSKCRALVAESLRRHGLQVKQPTGIDGSPVEPVQTGDDIEAKREAVQAMFRDPRYKSSPLYRKEVAEKLAALTANDGTIPADAMKTPGQTVSVGISSSPYRGADLAVRKFGRVEMEPTFTTNQAPVKPAPAPKEAFSE